MSTNQILKKTVLHSRHQSLGATMAGFGGWDMPLWYRAGAVKEHLAVIQAAGLFDTSHMDVLFVAGKNSRSFLNYAYTRDIASLKPCRAAYGAFLNASGHSVDDAIVYPFADDRFAVVVNAGMGPVIRAHLAGIAGAESLDIREPSERLAKLDLQGPASVGLLREFLSDADAVFASFPYFSCKGDFDLSRSDIRLRDGTPLLLSRTGYTGELGFEIFLPQERADRVWDELLAAGSARGVLPCGLAARDSLRTGAVLPLSHQDIGGWPFINHPWPFALPLAADGSGAFTKPFFGAEALDAAHSPHTLPFVGFDARRVDAHAGRVLVDGREAGTILTIVTDVAIGRIDGRVVSLSTPGRPPEWTPRGLACGFVKIDRRLEPGTEVVLKDDRREIKVAIAADIRPDRSARKKLEA